MKSQNHQIREIILYIDNTKRFYDYALWIKKGANKALLKDKFSKEQLLKATRRLLNEAIKSYNKEFPNFKLNLTLQSKKRADMLILKNYKD